MFKDLLKLLPFEVKEIILLEQFNNLSDDSKSKIIQRFNLFSINAPDAATALELVVKLRQLQSGIARLNPQYFNLRV